MGFTRQATDSDIARVIGDVATFAAPTHGARTSRAAVGWPVRVTAKLNMADGYRGGLWLEDSLQVARLLEADGALDALELTGAAH